ncbi:MAG: hypothetical protein JO233_06035 [Candidatus Eremiobacteraeota bacterium]|nr:hypothetical protein [Candidatus Eremiobacteraeota bacterium]
MTRRSGAFDWTMAIGGLWLIAGLFADLGWHIREDVDSFLTGAHAMLYSGLLILFIAAGVMAMRGVRSGLPLRRALPPGYDLVLPGLAIFLIGGILDAIGHYLYGFEAGFLALLSPTHQLIGVGLILVLTSPIRAALVTTPWPSSFVDQLPALIAAASFFELIHWGTNYIFPSGAERSFGPVHLSVMNPEALTAQTLAFSHQAGGLTSFLLQSLIMVGITLYLVRNFSLRPGSLTLLYLVGNGFIAFALATSWPQAFGPIVASLAAGIVADSFLLNAPALRTSRIRYGFFAFLVAVVYHAALLLYVIVVSGGTWWHPIFVFGALLYTGIFGFLRSLVAFPDRSQPA